MPKTGQNNGLTDVEGIMVGHFTDLDAVSGVTVIICPEGAVGGVDVRGAAPSTRQIELLEPHNLVEKIQAVTLSGGSGYGLAAADGVVAWLAERGWGFPLPEGHVVPIVPSAILFDLGRGKDFVPPVGPEWGRKACESAGNGPVTIGSVGAGTGALSGAIAGPVKGGIGTASVVLESGVTVAALMAVNSLGSVIDPETGRPWEIRTELDGEFGPLRERAVTLPEPLQPEPIQNTTIGVVATDAMLNKVHAKKIAQMAHDGLGRAIRPAHSMFDGDAIFTMATGKVELPDTPGFFNAAKAQAVTELGAAAADCVTRAIVQAILKAETTANMPAFQDLKGR